MSTAAVKVALRIRPMTATESLNGATECLLCVPNSNQVVIGIPDVPQRSFTYDYAFPHDATQDEVFSCVKPLVDEFIMGFNATVLAYGQTGMIFLLFALSFIVLISGSGKTFTMGTSIISQVDERDKGILPRAIEELFKRLQEQQDKNKDYSYKVAVSFLELYNEDLVDLLCPKENKSQMSIRENFGRIVWIGITEIPVQSPEEVYRYIVSD